MGSEDAVSGVSLPGPEEPPLPPVPQPAKPAWNHPESPGGTDWMLASAVSLQDPPLPIFPPDRDSPPRSSHQWAWLLKEDVPVARPALLEPV